MIAQVNLQNLIDVMKLMAMAEQLVADFYRTCAENFEEDRSFYMAIAAEEEKHARNIEKMLKMITLKPECFEMGRPFNQTALRTFMAGVEGNLTRLKEGVLSRERAMCLAYDVENAVIEKNYHEIVRTTDLEYVALLQEITKETVHHRESIEQRIQALKAGEGLCVRD